MVTRRFFSAQFADVYKKPNKKKRSSLKKSGNVPGSVALSILRVASVLAAVDGIYNSEERKKIREVAKLFPALKIGQSGLQELDGIAERMVKERARGGKPLEIFSTAGRVVDIEECLCRIVENPAWVFPAVIVWLAICCCDCDYCAIEQKVIARICDILSKKHNV